MDSTVAAVDDFLVQLARHGTTRNWDAGSRIVSEGDAGDAMYLVHEGQLRVFVTGAEGRAVELNTLEPGSIFGELMLHGHRRAASVEALTRVRLTQVPLCSVDLLLDEQPRLAKYLIQRLVERVRQLTFSVRAMGTANVYERVVALCMAEAVPHEGRMCIRGLSQQRMAERVGASRAMVNRLLHDLERGGYIRLERGCIALLRPLPPRW